MIDLSESTVRKWAKQPTKRPPIATHHATVEILHQEPSTDRTIKTIKQWARPMTQESLTEWIEDYLDMVISGYTPEGFLYVPIPHCARILHLGQVVAEWNAYPSPAASAESPVMAESPAGRGGIPAAIPSTTTSGALPSEPSSGLTVPIRLPGRYPHPTAVNDAGVGNRFRSGSGQPVA